MPSPCCALCKGPHGICLSRYACQHHKDADAQDDANHNARQTYRNPTADQAIRNITRSTKRNTKAAPKRPFSYPKEDK
ncbi:hypothetical protein SEA_ABBYDAISY_77 [Arthrobacter phage AbbyDaisy]|nr:hypothetical protein SEA_ABBYDAISY_77 [Arthrobacter phage AbbyDaisy]